MKKNISLAVDTCFSSGSLSLWAVSENLASVKINAEILLSKDILDQLREFLTDNELHPADLKQIIYTTGPGSNTGIRVGVATAQGLCRALQIRAYGVSAFEALLMEFPGNTDSESCTCVMMQGNNLCISKKFKRVNKIYATQTQIIQNTFENFVKDTLKTTSETIIGSSEFCKKLAELDSITPETQRKIIIASDNESKLAYRFFLANKTLLDGRKTDISYTGKY